MRLVSGLALASLLLVACGSDEATATTAPPTTTTSSTSSTTTTVAVAQQQFAPASLDDANFAYAAALTLGFEAGGVLLEIDVESDGKNLHIFSDFQGEPFETFVVNDIGYSSEAGGPFFEDGAASVDDFLSELDIRLPASLDVTYAGTDTVAGVATARWEGAAASVTEIMGGGTGIDFSDESFAIVWLDEHNIPMKIELEGIFDAGVLVVIWEITEVGDVTFEIPADLPVATGARTTQNDLRNVLTAFKVFYTDTESFAATTDEITAIESSITFVDPADLTFGSAAFLTFEDDQIVLIVSVALDGTYYCLLDNASVGTFYGQGATLDDVDSPEDCSAEAWTDQ